jgi:hypothetical protein
MGLGTLYLDTWADFIVAVLQFPGALQKNLTIILKHQETKQILFTISINVRILYVHEKCASKQMILREW